MAFRVAINGLGRIGRATFKIVMGRSDLELVAVNDLVPADNLAYLLNYDSVYGVYGKKIVARDDSLVVDGERSISVLQVKDPAELPWKDLGVDLAFECTGVFANQQGLMKHIQAGAKNAILSAPSKSPETATVVYGVNQPDRSAQAISCASCTTNAITPVVEIIGRRIGIKKMIMTTVHAYTSTQDLVDAPSKKWRRGRAAAVNIVPSTTGAAVATTKALPQYEGRFDGVSLRVPVPVGSIADITFLTERPTSVEEVNRILREETESERYREVVGFSEDEIVSSDVVRDPRGSIVEATMTKVVDGDLVKVMAWYDNEWGYSSQMVREAVRLMRERER